MDFTAGKIKELYSGGRAMKYDLALPHSFSKWKRKAIAESSINFGDHVLVFCCGTGLDFSNVIARIGPQGRITGVDFSDIMLDKAREKIRKNRWKNIELIEADVTDFQNALMRKADVGICTLGLSIIPDYRAAYYNLLSNVKKQGEIIIGDMQLATGGWSRLNPFTVLLSKGFGGTFRGHQNSLDLYELMKDDLDDLKKKEFFFKAYYYCIGKRKS